MVYSMKPKQADQFPQYIRGKLVLHFLEFIWELQWVKRACPVVNLHYIFVYMIDEER